MFKESPNVGLIRPLIIFVAIIAIALTMACHPAETYNGEAADIIFTGEHILTMDGSDVDAVAVQDGLISATGTTEHIMVRKGENTRLIELGDNALLPGFIDSHGHITAVARFLNFANIASPPVGPVTTISDIQNTMKTHIAKGDFEPGSWIIGSGYDDSLLEEKQHPTRYDLDQISNDNPIVLIHASIHLVVVNSKGLEILGIGPETDDPKGGHIQREPGTNNPNGVLEETAAFKALGVSADNNEETFLDAFRGALKSYASYGITTAQDGGSSLADVTLLEKAANESPFEIDVTLYPFLMGLTEDERAAVSTKDYNKGVRLAGVKFILDGSIQGKTGYLRDPYVHPTHGKEEDYRGYPTIPKEVVENWLHPMLERNVPVLMHANGDAAIELLIDSVESGLQKVGKADHRTVIIHSQMIRDDQLDRVKTLGLIPSYFSAHPYFWGDWHRTILGEERAARISPIRSTVERDIPFTIHNDAPVVPPDMMHLLWVTVNRETRSGYVLGEAQKATVMEALNAMTVGGAYQLFEEDLKGSITAGKQADFVILEKNPLTVNPSTLKDIEIIETIARGKTVYASN